MANVSALRSQVSRMLDKIGLKYMTDPDGDFWVPFEDAVVFVAPSVMGQFPVVKVWSYVAVELRSSAGLTDYLNEKNCDMVFGKLCYYGGNANNVKFETPVLATDLDESELKFAVGVAAAMTDEFNDPIVQKWGGKKFTM